MLKDISLFEIKRAFKKPSTYIYFGILTFLAAITGLVLGGAFPSINASITGDNINVNSPFFIEMVIASFGKYAMIIIAATTAGIIFRDFKYETHSLIFTTRIKRTHYIFGKFIAVFCINCFIFYGLSIGYILGCENPFVNPSYFGEFMPFAYLKPYLIRIVPMIFLLSAVFMTTTLIFRNHISSWIAIILIFVLDKALSSLGADLDNTYIVALLDPFGESTSKLMTKTWSPEDIISSMIPLKGVYLFNRLIWTGVGVVVLLWNFRRFSFSYQPRSLVRRKKKTEKIINRIKETYQGILPKVQFLYKNKWNWKVFLTVTKFEFKLIVKNIYFLLLILIGIIFVFVSSDSIGMMYDTVTYPVTYKVVDMVTGSFSLTLLIIVILFSGDMIWREKSNKVDGLLFTTPAPKHILLSSKFTALLLVQAIIFILITICGIVLQAQRGYYHFEIDLYFKELFGVTFISYINYTMLAFFIHSISKNKFAGYGILTGVIAFFSIGAPAIFEHNILIFNNAPATLYSDLNGYGFTLYPYFSFKFYWFFIAALLFYLSFFLWNNGQESNAKLRRKLAMANLKTKSARIGTTVIAALILISGIHIFYNTNILHDFDRSYTKEIDTKNYELKYKRWERKPQPKIVAVSSKSEIYPKEGKIVTDGSYWLKNQTNKTIDTIFVSIPGKLENFSIDPKFKHSRIEDDEFSTILLSLDQPMYPRDSLQFNFSRVKDKNGFSNGGADIGAQPNGTFVNSFVLPTIGYDNSNELSRNKIREKHGLPERKVMASRDDQFSNQFNVLNKASDFVRYSLIVGTSDDQVPVAPGKIIREWKENNRIYKEFRIDVPIMNFFSVLSAPYEIAEDTWTSPIDGKTIPLKIYHHKNHKYNIETMFNSMKNSLSFYSKNFSNFQYDNLSIVEFPRYAAFAQSFPTMIPFSEAIGFISDLREESADTEDFESMKLDFPYFVTAHEIAHQWWAHQVIPSNTEGANMIVESITQLSAMLASEEHFGKERIRKFLREESSRYFELRKKDNHKEQPLATVYGSQQHIFYQKGEIVLYALADLMGRDNMLKTLREFNKEFAYSNNYCNSSDLIHLLEKNTPDSLHHLITDWIENITLYDFRIKDAICKYTEQKTFIIDGNIDIKKFVKQENGKEQESIFNDEVEIAIYGIKGDLLQLVKKKLNSGDNKLEIELKQQPLKIIVDPYCKYITKSYKKPEKTFYQIIG
ncbi:MAG: M1 family aminopeptidase [Hyphomicrobiales bacterium]